MLWSVDRRRSTWEAETAGRFGHSAGRHQAGACQASPRHRVYTARVGSRGGVARRVEYHLRCCGEVCVDVASEKEMTDRKKIGYAVPPPGPGHPISKMAATCEVEMRGK